jgi:hypothetical protein
LSAVFEKYQISSSNDVEEAIHVGHAPVELRDHDRSRPRRDSPLGVLRIEKVVCADLSEDRCRTGGHDRGGRGDERMGREDHLVPRPDAGGGHDHLQRVRRVCHTDRVDSTCERRESFLEFE